MGQAVTALAALLALVGALGVVASRHPLRSALWLAQALLATAFCYLGLGADFASAAQVVVYVGAIVVLVVFAIMLLRLKGDSLDRRGPFQIAVAVGIGAFLLFSAHTAMKGVASGAAVDAGFGSAREIGGLLMDRALFPFEMTSLLLVAAMVSAIVLGRRTER